ncbi:uncharacterized protein [Pseudorasbora parva]|uniref:uncharacterized protein n=1 Tax=Pseudorasbora parva TaxID=51549 RepID=UPI00351EA413
MRDPCRICGVCVQGGQCRWLFSVSGRLKLVVVLSHVLGVDLQRDGRSEFLCGKCVFLLERVVQSDVAIEQLQETHAAQLQRLQKERDGLKTQITNKYRQHNPSKLGGSASQKPLKQEVHSGANLHSSKQLQRIQRPQPIQPKQRQAWTDNVQDNPGRSHGLVAVSTVGDGRQEKFKGQLRRSVSLEPLSKIGTDRSHRSKLNLCSCQSSDTRSRTIGVPVSRPRSLSRDYLDVVHKKSSLISRSTSLQSVALEQHDHASSYRQTRPLKSSTPATVETTSVVFDILQLLKIVQGARPVPHCHGSKIPVQKHPQYTRGNAHRNVSWKSRVERSLREMEEEFNDDYTPLKQEVHHSLAVRF